MGGLQGYQQDTKKHTKHKDSRIWNIDIDLNTSTEFIDHGGFRSDNSEKLDEFQSNDSAAVNESDIDGILNTNNISLLEGINMERKIENENANDTENANENTNTNLDCKESYEDNDTVYLQELMTCDTEELMPDNMSDEEVK